MDKDSKKSADAERYSRNDSDYERKIHELIGRMSENIGLNVSNESYPEVRVTSLNRGGYDEHKNVIYISENNLNSGVIIGEEIGHFLRELSLKNKPAKESLFQKKYTDEFFGFLGGRILERVSNRKDQLDFKLGYTPYDLKTIVPNLKKSKKELRKLAKDYNLGIYPKGKKEKDVEERVDKLIGYRLDVLQHQRPYHFAAKLDINRLDLQQLYSMSDKEVRDRFFREDPEYDFNTEIKPGKVSKRITGLESVIKIILITLFISSIFIYTQKIITGNVINSGFNNTPFEFMISGLIIIVSGILIYFFFKKN